MTVETLLANKYYICFPTESEPIAWDITQFVRPDCAYWGKVFEVVEQQSTLGGLTFYLTWDTQSLPTYGNNVVAVILGDERCCIPNYCDQVRAIFKCYGIRPILGYSPWQSPSWLGLLTLIHFLRNWFGNLPQLLNYRWQRMRARNSAKPDLAPIYEIPLGYYNQLDLPIKALDQRPYDIFFAGSILHGLSFTSPFNTPKSLSRKQMVANLERFRHQQPEFNIKLDILSAFPSVNTLTDSDASSYSDRMMNTKICLVPRGGSFETFRFFEGLRYGCIVITETLPPHWFYQGVPAIQIKNWHELPEVLTTLLANPQQLQEYHQAALIWWRDYCSETAVGNYIAEKLSAEPRQKPKSTPKQD
jgi:hypothetical protein